MSMLTLMIVVFVLGWVIAVPLIEIRRTQQGKEPTVGALFMSPYRPPSVADEAHRWLKRQQP